MELPKLVVIGLTVIGLGSILLAGYVVRRLSMRAQWAPQPPKRETTWDEVSQARTYGDSDHQRARKLKLMDKPEQRYRKRA